MEWISENYGNICAIITGLIAVATVIVKMTPSQKDDAVLEKIVGLLNYFSIAEKKPTKDA